MCDKINSSCPPVAQVRIKMRMIPLLFNSLFIGFV